MSEKKEKTITLVMIVKNESKVITRCLDSVKDYIDFWVICDTGSTDNTKNIIIEYFEKAKIPGELHQHQWKNFGHNRSLAVQAAKGKSDYSLLLDADFVFIPKDKNFKQTLTADGYQIKYEGDLDYRQMLFVKASLDWKYVGVTHEYITCGKPANFQNLDAFTIHHKCDGGSRSDKFTRDIKLLKGGLEKEPENSRYMFYLAQSYKDTKDYDNAIKWYQKRIDKGGWPEEVYYSIYQKGACMKMRGDKFDDYKETLLQAHKFRPTRLEALYEVVRHCRMNNMPDLGFSYGISAINNTYPKDVLFIIKPIHDWMFFDEMALCAHKINRSDISIQLYNRMMPLGVIPRGYAQQFTKNYECFKNSLLQISKKQQIELENRTKIAIIIVNYNMKERADNIIEKINKTVKHPHDIILVDNGSDLVEKSKYTTLSLKKNVQTTHGWLMGLHYADSLEVINKEKYFAYCFVITSAELVDDKDIVSTMFKTMKEDKSVVGIHPSLTKESTTNWKHLLNNPIKDKEKVFMVDNIFSCYRASWFNSIGRFNNELTYAWGIDMETAYFAHRDNLKIILDHTIQVSKETDVGYKMNRMNMSSVERTLNANKEMTEYFIRKYGKNYQVLLRYDLHYYHSDYIAPIIINDDKSLSIDNKSNENHTEKIINDLECGLSFLIRAKNEDKNIVKCLDTLVKETEGLDNIEIIVVDNNSSDKTYKLANNYVEESERNIKLYKYDKDICKVGENNIKNKPSIATYYNWCLEKVTKYNVIKWDADFIVHKNNLRDMITEYKLNIRDDNFAIWFTGETLFEHRGNYLKKVNSFYDSYKGFSKRHCNKWKDYSNLCEYINTDNIETKLRYEDPVFYELFRTDVDEFSNKHILMDRRDKVDNLIYKELKRESIFYNHDNQSQLEKFNFSCDETKKTYFVVYYGYHMNTGGTYVTLKTYVDYFLENGDIVYVFERMPCDEEISRLKPDCIISAQFANSDVNKKIKEWKLPHVVLTFAPNQYVFNGPESKYPSLVTYSNSFIKSKDPLQKNGYIVRDPIDHERYAVKDKDPTYITLIGSPPNVKGHDIFIKLAELMPNTKFMLVTHENEFKEKTYPSNIKLQGYLKNIEELKEKVYAKTKVLLLPSIQEAYGRVTIEATASDIPCILSDYPGLSDATYKMSNYVTNYKDVNEWKNELERVLENYEDEVIKASKIRDKLDFNRDVKYFRDLVLETTANFN